MGDLIITILVAFISGYLFLKIKIPGGMMVGSIIGVTMLNILSSCSHMPLEGRIIAQIIAGAYIGVGIDREVIKNIKNIYKPAIVIILGLLILNIVVGILIYKMSPLDLSTSLMSAVPGGISDIPIISEEMGADPTKVVAMQFIRLLFSIGVFPGIINNSFKDKNTKINKDINMHKESKNISIINFLNTLLIASVSGLIGKYTHLPASILLFSMIGTMSYNMLTRKAFIPLKMRRLAQLLSGAYIGSKISILEFLEFRYLFIPGLILVLGYFFASLLIGSFLHNRFAMPLKDAMLSATPAGASDMALISAEFGINNPNIIILQVIRLVTAVSIFPLVIKFITFILK